MSIDPVKGLVTVFMVQHAGYPTKEGDSIYPTFIRAAREAFAK
jgi:hypothetical protein